MPEDETRDGLRVGGWVPPYSADGSAPSPRIRPAARPALPRGAERRALGPGRSRATPSRTRLLVAAALALGCATAAAVTFALDGDESPAQVSAQTEFVWPPVPASSAASPAPTGTISLLPKPSATSASKPVTPSSPAGTTHGRSHRPSPAKPSASRTPSPAAPSLAAGSTVGLEAAGHPGVRVRHREFRGRLDPVAATSSEVDRADSRFAVRPGLANANCFSLESVNFPGYFLRHRNFEIRLDRSDRTELFDQDATFCTVAIQGNSALALRAVNYPGHHVVADGDRLVLREGAAETATGFMPRSPL
ncbi:AbfB domain-containing protein [Actinoplanes sp. NPDC024001]|uniref:AbfB domain-containing protein n=1 Tax=Actinoplanes sp. NPDC024001 TaxID=3154598 RepID=UPI0033E514E0